jgi:molybdopterin-guanine dinucleotide biosynthesis protein A
MTSVASSPGSGRFVPAPAQITGLVLAGGRGSRMGGVDKGLQPLRGEPLARIALARLAPQVGALLVSANRHLDRYAAFGAPVVRDSDPDFPGPLAGIAAGLQGARTPWLATVPCDAPFFPADLVARLAEAIAASGASIGYAASVGEDGRARRHPVCALLRCALADDLRRALDAGERKVGAWYARHMAVEVTFDDEAAFYNVNTLPDLQAIG